MSALKSLYGEGHAEATRTRESAAMPGYREQSVFTPTPIIGALVQLWGEIAHDPCHGPPGIVLTAPGRAFARSCGGLTALLDGGLWTHDSLVAAGLAVHVESCVPAHTRTSTQGLIAPWPDATYWNPPYGALRQWLEYSETQPVDWIALVPVRTHRPWWRAWALSRRSVVYLNPVRFLGYEQSFPAPLALVRNVPASDTRLLEICKSCKLC